VKRLRRTADIIFFYGFRAAPGLMWTTLVLSIVNGFAIAFFPFGFKVFTDAFLAHRKQGMVAGAALSGVLIAISWAAANLDAGVGYDLIDRVRLYISVRIAELVNAVPGVEHFERPDYLQELDLIDWNRGLLASGPRLTLNALQMIVRGGTMAALLVTVHPALIILPIFAAAPAFGEAWSVRIRQRCEERINERRRLADQLFALAATAGPAKEVRIFGLGAELRRRHDDLAAEVRRETVRAAFVGAIVGAVGWVIFVAGFLAGVGFVLLQAVHGLATPGQVVLAVVVGQQVRLYLQQAAGAFGQLFTTARTAQRILWLEDFAKGDATGSRTTVPSRLTGGISFAGVTFRYPGTQNNVLVDVDLSLPAGSIVAIVGENGAGKTTLVKLLSRMYDPTSGTIRVDGTDLRSFDLDAWRSNVSAAFQDFVQFELVASETVGVGDLPRIDDASAIDAALERAGARDVFSGLADGYGTELGSSFVGGRELSGGQWQKLALGRGMMRDQPLLLVLDEPTASLDAETEHQLFERYVDAARRTRANFGGITILVSHRFSTVRAAGLIVVLNGGRVVETGSHAELMTRRGLYAELFSLQAKAYR
jgi:ATP-binding cassette subfamily B protein